MDQAIQKKLKDNIWKFYLHEICVGMFFVIPVIVLFWQANGLSLFQIMLLQSIFSIATVVLEVPTGYFAGWFTNIFSLTQTLGLLGILALLVGGSVLVILHKIQVV